MDRFLDAALFGTGAATAINGKKVSTGAGGPTSPVTSPILPASTSGGTRVCVNIYIYLNVFSLRTCSTLLWL